MVGIRTMITTVVAMSVIAVAIIPAAPVAAVPRIIARAVIHADIAGIIPVVSGRWAIGITIIRTATVISRAAHPNAEADMNASVGLAGEAQHAQQRKNQ